MGGFRSNSGLFFGKSSQNSTKEVLLFWSSIPYVFCYYDLSVLSMSVKGFQKSLVLMGVGGWGELYPSLYGIIGICFNLAKPLACLLRSKLASPVGDRNGDVPLAYESNTNVHYNMYAALQILISHVSLYQT